MHSELSEETSALQCITSYQCWVARVVERENHLRQGGVQKFVHKCIGTHRWAHAFM